MTVGRVVSGCEISDHEFSDSSDQPGIFPIRSDRVSSSRTILEDWKRKDRIPLKETILFGRFCGTLRVVIRGVFAI